MVTKEQGGKAAPIAEKKKASVRVVKPLVEGFVQPIVAKSTVIEETVPMSRLARSRSSSNAKQSVEAKKTTVKKTAEKKTVETKIASVSTRTPSASVKKRVTAKAPAKIVEKRTTKPKKKLQTNSQENVAQNSKLESLSPLEQMQAIFLNMSTSSVLVSSWQQLADQMLKSTDLIDTHKQASLFDGLNAQAADISKMVEPEDLQRLRDEYMAEMATLWQSYVHQQSVELTDKRFASAAWHSNAWANYLAQSYLINAHLMLEMADCVKADAKTKTRVRFAVMQWVDSLAPSNFFATNPDAQQKLIETQGESLKMGINNFLTDLQKGKISQTDETAFEIGVNIARSDGAVVFENDYFQLIQYTPLTEKVRERPLLIVPPCINKYYILDLQPDNSLVRHAVESGNVVYMVSWRNADASVAQATWDDYVSDVVIRAIHIAQEISGQAQINALGFCIGGTLLATALAVLNARGESCVSSLTLLASLLDFSDNGVLDAYVDEQKVSLREETVGAGGIVKGQELSNAFATLRPNDLVWNYVVSNYLKGEQPAAFDLLYWNSDVTNIPGPMFCWYLRNTYLENRLVKKNDVVCCGEKVDLTRVQLPTYVLSCREDHIVPWVAAFRSQEILNGNKRFVLAASGHIAGVVNSAKKNKRNFWINPKASLNADPSEWLETAEERAGSWWNDWTAWLKDFSGKDVETPKSLGSSKYKPIEAAPGRYVKVRTV